MSGKSIAIIVGLIGAAAIGVWAAVDEIRTSKREEKEEKEAAKESLRDLTDVSVN